MKRRQFIQPFYVIEYGIIDERRFPMQAPSVNHAACQQCRLTGEQPLFFE